MCVFGQNWYYTDKKKYFSRQYRLQPLKNILFRCTISLFLQRNKMKYFSKKIALPTHFLHLCIETFSSKMDPPFLSFIKKIMNLFRTPTPTTNHASSRPESRTSGNPPVQSISIMPNNLAPTLDPVADDVPTPSQTHT